MNRQEKIEYYQRCIKAYKKRVPASAYKQHIKWYEDAIKREEQIHINHKNIDKATKEQKLIYYKNWLQSYKKRNSPFVNSLDDDVYEKHIAWYKETIKELKQQIKKEEEQQPGKTK